MEELVKCPRCKGKKKLFGYDSSMGGVPTPPTDCYYCDGKGEVPYYKAARHPDFRPNEKKEV